MDHAIYNEQPTNLYSVSATDVWDIHQEDRSAFSNNQTYQCPGCKVPLLLVGLNNNTPKRVYFRTFSNHPHENDCEEFYSSEKNSSYLGMSNEEDGIISTSMNTLLFKQKNRSLKKKIINEDSSTTFDKTASIKKTSKTLTVDEYHSRRSTSFSLHRICLIINNAKNEGKSWENIPVEFEWPHIDKYGEIKDFSGVTTDRTTLGNIVKGKGNIPSLPNNNDYIYYVDVRVSLINNQYGELYQFDFEDDYHFVKFSLNRLKGLANINKVKLAEKNNDKLKIMLCGHFFNSAGDIVFSPRTPYVSDFITIPDE